MYNIGQCEAAAKRYGLAFEAFEKYLAEGGDEIPEDRRNEVLAELNRLEQMVGSLEIAAPKGALITLNGVERGRAPFPGKLKVVAGILLNVEVTLDGKVIHSDSFKVSRGETAAIALSLNSDLRSECPDGVCSSDDAQQKLNRRDALSPTSTALISVGAVVAAASVPFWFLYRRSRDTREIGNRLIFQLAVGDGSTGIGVSGRF